MLNTVWLYSKLGPIHLSVISGARLACAGHWAYCAPSDPGRLPSWLQHWHTGLHTPAVSRWHFYQTPAG